jgi:class 3 adenylate cyclase/tetratricopeptide (TPR) repeat protein
MQCPRCQHENPPDSRFCFECGSRLALACVSCGAELPPGVKFCNQCGQPVGTRSTARDRATAPEVYTPKHLAEKILTSKAALEGERKQVTVLFADLKGSMELLADRDPEEARKLLDPVLERMMEAVHRYEGTVNQVMGDGIMALFGVPLAHEDHAVRACYAALRMQESVKRYADGVFRTYGVPVRIRVGLNSGEVVVRAIGSDLHMDYTAVGQTTHLAARMEQIADPGTIRLTADTLHLAEGFVQVQPLGPTPVKGLATLVEVYELTGASSVRSRLQATAARGLTKFVGRDAEMEVLFGALEQAKAGHGQVVAVVGEPGVGKSRLVWEFMRSYRTEGSLVLEAPSVSYGKATTYLPVIDLLKRYAGIQPHDDARKIREQLTGKLFSLDRTLEPCLAPLLWLLDVPVEDGNWAQLDPSLRRQRVHEGLRRMLLRESREQLLVLVFEDLHWIDGETQAVLDGIVESLPTARVLLLVNYRPEYRHTWNSKTYYAQVRLDALPATSAAALLDALLGPDTSVQPLVPLLIKRTEGNPFFLEEMVANLVETRTLVGGQGAYRLVRAPEALSIPTTARAILSARIDRLTPEDKRLLQTAAVIGKDVAYPLLAVIADLEEGALRAGLSRLRDSEFLYEVQLFPELEYTFKHALTHEVAYGTLVGERRRALHARLVDAIEQVYAGRLDEQVERLAQHALRSELWERAVGYAQRAGMKAAFGASYREAVTAFEEALRAIERLAERRDVLEQAIDIRFKLRSSLQALGELARARDHLDRAHALATRLDDKRRLARAACYLGNYHFLCADSAASIAWGERALEAATASNDVLIAAETAAYLAMTYYFLGDLPLCMEWAKRSLTRLASSGLRELSRGRGRIQVFAHTYRVWCLAERGDFAAAVAGGEDAVSLADAIGHPFVRVFAYLGLGIARLRQGELEKAAARLDAAVGLCEEGQFGLLEGFASAPLGLTRACTGAIDTGRGLIERALERDTGKTLFVTRPLHLAYLAEATLLSGAHTEAERHAAHALTLAGEQGSRLAAIRDTTAAEEGYKSGLHLGEELGMRPLVAQGHLGLGKLYGRTGQRRQSQAHFTTATTMYREMDMRFWLERAEAEMRESLGVPPA